MKKIPPFDLVPKATNEKAKKIKISGDKFKLGGDPDFIQSKQVPLCPSCKQQMSFYAQLDSINEEFNIADSDGMIYIFYCFDCFEVKAIVQSN
jgi:hypothetical protein